MKKHRQKKSILLLLALALTFLFLVPETPVMAADSAVEEEERVLFVGDSRAVDMFSSTKGSIDGKKKNGIKVYARDGATFAFLQESVDRCKLKNFDTLVVWMGTNDSGNFSNYKAFYNRLIKKGKRVILCTVGPIEDSLLSDFWRPYFSDALTANQYNSSLKKWAEKKEVDVINTYSYVKKKVRFLSDGIHYEPSSSKKIWKYILKRLEALDVSIG